MSREKLDQLFLQRHKRRVIGSINPFSAPISYSQQLRKALQRPLKQELNPIEENKFRLKYEKPPEVTLDSHEDNENEPFLESFKDHQIKNSGQRQFKIRRKKKQTLKQQADSFLKGYKKLMSKAKKKRHLNQLHLQKYNFQDELKREEMLQAKKRKKVKLEAVKRTINKHSPFKRRVPKNLDHCNPFKNLDQKSSQSIYQLSPALSRLAKIRFPNLKVDQDPDFEASGFKYKPSLQKVMKRHKELTSRNNHMYIYSNRRSHGGSHKDKGELQHKWKGFHRRRSVGYSQKLNKTTNSYVKKSYSKMGRKTRSRSRIDLKSQNKTQLSSNQTQKSPKSPKNESNFNQLEVKFQQSHTGRFNFQTGRKTKPEETMRLTGISKSPLSSRSSHSYQKKPLKPFRMSNLRSSRINPYTRKMAKPSTRNKRLQLSSMKKQHSHSRSKSKYISNREGHNRNYSKYSILKKSKEQVSTREKYNRNEYRRIRRRKAIRDARYGEFSYDPSKIRTRRRKDNSALKNRYSNTAKVEGIAYQSKLRQSSSKRKADMQRSLRVSTERSRLKLIGSCYLPDVQLGERRIKSNRRYLLQIEQPKNH